MSRNVAIERLIESERDGDLWSRRVLGQPVWPLERLYRYRVLSLAAEGAPAESRHNPARNLATRAAASARDLARGGPATRRGRDVWVLGASNYRRRDDDGVFQCAFAEHLREQMGDRLLFIERNQAAHPSLGRQDVVFVDAALMAAELAGRAAGPFLAATPAGADARRSGSPTPPSVLCRHGVYGRLALAWARRLVRRAQPRAVFVLGAYHMMIPFQAAVREAGIPLVELQHGIIHESHPGYVLGDMPELRHLPDHMVVFGRQFGEMLERECPRWAGRWSVGGHPWLRRKRRGVEAADDSAFDSVVFFSQPHAPVREQFRPLLPELRAALPPSVRLVLKPHPRELDAREYYRGMADIGVEFASPRDDTYDILRRCRVAVSVYSTVAMEALAFRCRSAVLAAPLLPDEFRALVEQGCIDLVSGAAQIADLAALPPRRDSHEDVANRLFGVLDPEPDFEALIGRLGARAGRT